jgi:3-hydroxyisobutyrate dehydrogenase-like beta-hydroxyacid dehydrogenase
VNGKIASLGFIGLGQMGRPMAMHLLKSGAPLTVMSRRGLGYDDFSRAGARTARDVADVAPAEVIFLCLPDSEAVRNVVLGDNGLLGRLKSGQVIVDTSTISYSATLELAAAVRTSGASFLDAPVSGMEARAKEGTLTVMCGGPRSAFERVEPLLRLFGNKILHMGETGSGQLTKLVNQLLFDINCAALAEILPMSVKLGLDPVMVGEVVNSGTGKSYASEFFIPRILKNDFSAGYPLEHAYKDLVSAADIGGRNAIPMPVLAAASATYQMALLRGHGHHDKGAMIKVFEEALGVEFRAPGARA